MLDRDFNSIVVENLSKISKEAIKTQLDPANMTPAAMKKIKKDILHNVYGKQSKACFFFHAHARYPFTVPLCFGLLVFRVGIFKLELFFEQYFS
jgi:hypothetical protein